MVSTDIKDKHLEKIYERFKWTRRNTFDLFKKFQHSSLSNSLEKSELLYQFQCIITTTDAYIRRIDGSKNIKFGILIKEGKIIKKTDIKLESVYIELNLQMKALQKTLRGLTENKALANLSYLLTALNHEYLHQGQLITMFFKLGIKFPKIFKKAWNL